MEFKFITFALQNKPEIFMLRQGNSAFSLRLKKPWSMIHPVPTPFCSIYWPVKSFATTRGGDLGGGWTGGRSPKNFRWGKTHASVPPNILRSSVVGCGRKYEQSKKRCYQGILL